MESIDGIMDDRGGKRLKSTNVFRSSIEKRRSILQALQGQAFVSMLWHVSQCPYNLDVLYLYLSVSDILSYLI